MVLALFEESQRRKAFLPLLFEWVPGKPYVIQPLAAFRGEGVFISALHADPLSQPVVALFVISRNLAMVLALFEENQRRKAFLRLLFACVPGKPYVVQPMAAFWGEGVFIIALSVDPPSQTKVALFVSRGNPAMVLALFEESQRRKAFLPLLFEWVPDKPYVIQPLAAFWGEGVFIFALTADPRPQLKVALFVTYRNLAMVLTLFEENQRRKAFLPLLFVCVPDKPYVIQPLAAFRGEGVFFALVADPLA